MGPLLGGDLDTLFQSLSEACDAVGRGFTMSPPGKCGTRSRRSGEISAGRDGMRVLLVTYHFPPDAEIGGVRPHQIARHLPQFGVEPWVLTVAPEFAESPNAGLLPVGVPDDRIVRTQRQQVDFRPGPGTVAVRSRPLRARKQEQQPGEPPRRSPPERPVGVRARDWLTFPDESSVGTGRRCVRPTSSCGASASVPCCRPPPRVWRP